MTGFEVMRGGSPLILGIPHTGIFVPEIISDRLNDTGKMLSDTDWHIHNLFNGLVNDVTVVRATFHRYVIDANRDPSGQSLYPGQNTTGLVPETDFDNNLLWADPPSAKDINQRLNDWHVPYHDALRSELNRIQAIHGHAILFDCHSIRSVVPHLFSGTLPDLNIGTNEGITCDPRIEALVVNAARDSSFSHILNGRFKGGWTTRHYGEPFNGVHAIQLEIAQSTYLTDESPPWTYNTNKAAKLRLTLHDMLAPLQSWRPK